MEIPREWTLGKSDLKLITDARCVGNWVYDIHFLFAKSIYLLGSMYSIMELGGYT
jgi:hypothetical protein